MEAGGTIYTGPYRNGRKEGKGVVKMSNGCSYQVSWWLVATDN